MKTISTLIATLILTASLAANAAEGKIIARKDLPAAIQGSTAKKAPKFPGVPSCAKGRLETTTWPESVAKGGHKCADASTLYVCASFGKISVRCE